MIIVMYTILAVEITYRCPLITTHNSEVLSKVSSMSIIDNIELK